MTDEQAASPRIRTRPTTRRVRVHPGPLLAERVDPEVFDSIAPGQDPYAPKDNPIPESIADRFRYFTRMGRVYAQDYVDKTVHHLLTRGVASYDIAREFRVSVRTVYTWRERLRERFIREAEATDFRPLFHDTMLFFEEARAMALTQYAKASTTLERVACVNSAVRSQAGLHRFLSLSGFFDTRRLPDRSGEDPQTARADRVVDMVQDAFGVFEQEDPDDDAVVLLDAPVQVPTDGASET